MTASRPVGRLVLGVLAALGAALVLPPVRAAGGPVPTDAQIRAAAAEYFRVTYSQNPTLLYEGLQIDEGRVYKRHRPAPVAPEKGKGVQMIEPMTGNFPAGDQKNWKAEENWLADLVYRVRYTRTTPKGVPAAVAEQHAVPGPRGGQWALAYLSWKTTVRGGQRIDALEFTYVGPPLADATAAEQRITSTMKGHGGLLEPGLFPGQQGDWVLPLVDAPRPTGYPLCPGAVDYFGSTIDPKRPTYIRADYDEIQAGFKRALDDYGKQGTAVISVPSDLGWVDAGLFLFGQNPPAATARRFSFTKPEERDGVRQAAAKGDLWDGTFKARRGTEAALIAAMHDRWKKKQQDKLDPGDVLQLALEQTDGDVRMAMLLAHNTLRAAGRGEGDVNICGISPNTEFFRTHLKTLRGGGNPGENPSGRPDYWDDNEGVWYRLFGVGFYEMQSAGAGPMSNLFDWPDMSTAQIQREMSARLASMGKDDVSSVNALAVLGEQVYREWVGGQRPDPEKFCFNVWGARAAEEVFRRVVATGQVRGGKVGPGDVAPGVLPNDWQHRRVSTAPFAQPQPPDAREKVAHRAAIYSPVSVTWDGGGQRLVFDQKAHTLTGSFPVRIVPIVEADGTVGLIWVDASTAPYTLTLRGDGSGVAHFIRWEPGGTRGQGWVMPVKPGEAFTMRVDPARSDSPLVDAGGREVPPVGAVARPRPGGTPTPTTPQAPVTLLFDNNNPGAVSEAPARATEFTLTWSSRVPVRADLPLEPRTGRAPRHDRAPRRPRTRVRSVARRGQRRAGRRARRLLDRATRHRAAPGTVHSDRLRPGDMVDKPCVGQRGVRDRQRAEGAVARASPRPRTSRARNSPDRSAGERRRARAGLGDSIQLESTKIHDLGPRGHEVAHELLPRVVARVDFRERTELGVRAEDEVDAAAGPLELARPTCAALEGLRGVGRRPPFRGHVQEVHEEVVRQRARPPGENAAADCRVFAPRTRMPPRSTVISGALSVSSRARSTSRCSAGSSCPAPK